MTSSWIFSSPVVVGRSWCSDTQGPPKATGGSPLRLSSCLQHQRGEVSALNTCLLKSGVHSAVVLCSVGPTGSLRVSSKGLAGWTEARQAHFTVGKSTIIGQKGGRPEDEFWESVFRRKVAFQKEVLSQAKHCFMSNKRNRAVGPHAHPREP